MNTQQSLLELSRTISQCRQCSLCETRTKTVFGSGSPGVDIMFVGEGPGYHEDQEGKPFVGRAGDLLTRMIKAIGYEREQVYIANVVKCRPPNNRVPTPEEVAACRHYLDTQIQLVNPKIIISLGATAGRRFTEPNEFKISKERGALRYYSTIPVVFTYHPAYLLRNPDAKSVVWRDLQQVLEFLKQMEANSHG